MKAILDILIGEPNPSRRIYPFEEVQTAIDVFTQTHIESRKAFIEFASDGLGVDLSRIVGMIDDMHIKDNKVEIEYHITETPCGKIVAALIDENISPIFRLISVGMVTNFVVSEMKIYKVSINSIK